MQVRNSNPRMRDLRIDSSHSGKPVTVHEEPVVGQIDSLVELGSGWSRLCLQTSHQLSFSSSLQVLVRRPFRWRWVIRIA